MPGEGLGSKQVAFAGGPLDDEDEILGVSKSFLGFFTEGEQFALAGKERLRRKIELEPGSHRPGGRRGD